MELLDSEVRNIRSDNTVTPKTEGECTKIGLVPHPVDDRKKWINGKFSRWVPGENMLM